MNILRRAGIVRKCRTCGAPLTGNRYMYCSDKCQVWKQRVHRSRRTPVVPLFDATSNILRLMENQNHDSHVILAWKIACEFSELRASEFFGPCYEGVIEACQSGVDDENNCREFAQRAIKQMWKETKTWGRTLGELKELIGWEPVSY